jgi:U3 small nucleolar ribonucleoprotein protein LCP5
MIEGRVVLEKIKVLENRMRYQIEKLVRVAEDSLSTNQNTIDGTNFFYFCYLSF